MQQMNASRRDPAPSRWGYKYQRMMLTPGFRRLVRVGLPLMLLAVIAVAWFGKPENRALAAATYEDIRTSIQSRPEFMVSAMAIDGADTQLEEEIRIVLPIDFPISSFELDLEVMRDTVQEIGAVKEATMRVKSGGILQVDVTRREPIAIWRQASGLAMVDETGAIIGPLAHRGERPDLPLIIGEGARDHLSEALTLTRAAAPLGGNMRGLVRMGERRWDILLEGDKRILLPAERPVIALQRVIVMAQTQDLLERDILVVDMRNGDRPTIRLGESATVVMRRIYASVAGAGN